MAGESYSSNQMLIAASYDTTASVTLVVPPGTTWSTITITGTGVGTLPDGSWEVSAKYNGLTLSFASGGGDALEAIFLSPAYVIAQPGDNIEIDVILLDATVDLVCEVLASGAGSFE